MKVFAISDLHLSINSNKPMNIFGPVWDGYLDKIEKDWKDKVTEDDIVLIPGDISWAMRLNEAIADIQYIRQLPGHIVLLRGNHDYWWSGISAVRSILPHKMYAVQNDVVRIGNVLLCGSRGWTVPEDKHKTPEDEKIFLREGLRLELSLQAMQRVKQEGDHVVVMMHYPPFNSKLEDSLYTDILEKYGVEKVVYGHLHAYDKKQNHELLKNGITYYLTSCDLVGNKLTLIDEVVDL